MRNLQIFLIQRVSLNLFINFTNNLNNNLSIKISKIISLFHDLSVERKLINKYFFFTKINRAFEIYNNTENNKEEIKILDQLHHYFLYYLNKKKWFNIFIPISQKSLIFGSFKWITKTQGTITRPKSSQEAAMSFVWTILSAH